MANEIHMGAVHLVWRNAGFKQSVSAFGRTTGGQQPEPCRHAVDMRIDWESWMATGEEQDAGDRLRPYPWKFRQEGPRGWHRHMPEEVQAQSPIACL